MQLITQPVGDDLNAVLCVDRRDAVVSLTPEQAKSTGMSREELWQLATQQIDDGLSVTEDHFDPGVHAVYGQSHFVASRVLDLERFARPLGPHGAVVAIPTRHMLIFHRIETLAVMRALHVMGVLADEFHREEEGAIVPHLYWQPPAGALLRIPVTVGDEGFVVEPPEEFLDVLNRLPA